MLTTKLLSKYLAKQAAKKQAEQKAEIGRVSHNNLKPKFEALEFDDGDESIIDIRSEPLTAAQAKVLRDKFAEAGHVISPWKIVAGQAVLGAIMALLAWLVTGKSQIGISVAYGVLAVVLPAALFARGLMSRFSSINAVSAGFGFFVWEFIKIMVTLVLIAIAPKLVDDLDWLAMLIGLIVTMQLVFVLLWISPKMVKKASDSSI